MILITQHEIYLAPLATTQQTLLYMMLLMQHFSQTLQTERKNIQLYFVSNDILLTNHMALNVSNIIFCFSFNQPGNLNK